jgi:hypothetical protein
MLAADYDTLPRPMRDAVIHFFDDNEAWLTGVLEQGREEGARWGSTDPRTRRRRRSSAASKGLC